MNALEALEQLKDLTEYLTRIDFVTAEIREEVKQLLIKSYEDSNGLFSQIEEALKRNEPKVLINDETFGPLVLHCPSCKAFVGFDKSIIKNYCPDCGQKLDLE